MSGKLVDETIDFAQYTDDVRKSESIDFDAIIERLDNPLVVRFFHALSGMVTEVGELEDIKKKFVFYGKELDRAHIREEIGDLMWYVAIACDTMGFSFKDILEKNIEKLKARYPEGWEKKRSLNRDLQREGKILGKE